MQIFNRKIKCKVEVGQALEPRTPCPMAIGDHFITNWWIAQCFRHNQDCFIYTKTLPAIVELTKMYIFALHKCEGYLACNTQASVCIQVSSEWFSCCSDIATSYSMYYVHYYCLTYEVPFRRIGRALALQSGDPGSIPGVGRRECVRCNFNLLYNVHDERTIRALPISKSWSDRIKVRTPDPHTEHSTK